MVREYPKGQRIPLGAKGIFTTADFDCHCTREDCLVTLVADELVDGLEIYWGIAGPFVLDSAFRCYAHNADPSVGGAKDSQHPLGHAADCKSKKYRGPGMAQLAEKVPVFREGGIGTYLTFCHVDVRGYRARWGLGRAC